MVSKQEVVFGLKELLTYEGNVEEDMALTFQVSLTEYNEVVTVPLVENAQKMAVTNANRHEFVRLYLDWILNKGIYEKFRAFYLGFHSVCASNALIVNKILVFNHLFYIHQSVDVIKIIMLDVFSF